ncbi:MAG: D-alanyl-D-alanine carboxypeptidase/D-alanyl-D-alanine-endopeptidase [Bacteroidota bacterium]
MHSISLCALLLLLPTFAFSQSGTQKLLDQTARAENLQAGMLGAYAVKVNNGQVIAQHNAQKIHIPASTLKAVTTATALGILGADYQFKTELQYDGRIEDGILRGNLYIKGFGDPTLGSDQMQEATDLETVTQEWVAAIQKAGIQRIEGKIIGDGSYFKGNMAGRNWQWSDLGNYYASGVWGLNLHENFYYLSFQQQARLGMTPPVAKVSPEVPNLYFINELKSAGRNTGDNAYIYGGPYAYTRFIRGTIPVGSGLFTIKGSLPDPPFFAAHQLLYALEEAGIATARKLATDIEEKSTSTRTTFHTHYSPKLSAIAKRANYKSVNIYCESMLRAIGAKSNAKNSLQGGINATKTYWEQKGVNVKGWYLEDGSGLSARNGITPKQLAQILQIIARDKTAFQAFYNTLPVGGQSGTIKYLFKGTRAQGNIRAKSGSIGRVRAYAGYATTRSGELVAFTFLANNYTGGSGAVRKQLERLMVSLCD